MLLYFIILIALSGGCNIFSSGNEDGKQKLVPDNTPFIASLLEVTDDTVHHYPEVYVGTVTFNEGFNDNLPCCPPAKGIWWPTLNAQVMKTARRMDLVRSHINKAQVSITGPLDTEHSKKVHFKNEGLGVYGDQNYELELIEEGRYRLDVTLPDSSRYRAVTTLPQMAQFEVPDTLRPQLELVPLQSGGFIEQTPEFIRFDFTEAPNAEMTEAKINESTDREVFFLEENEQFLFSDKGNYLRYGAFYLINHNEISSFADSTFLSVFWDRDSGDPLIKKNNIWMYLRQLNSDMSNPWYHQPIFTTIAGGSDDLWDKQDQKQVDAFHNRDTEYLFEISNILKVGENDKVLPEEQSDAIGVFGGFSSVYRKTVMIPQRSWDPDSLNWGPED